MRVLLDTHVALWAVTDDARLGQNARRLISNPRHVVQVSVVTLWEIVIKHAIKPAAMPVSGAQAEGWFLAAGYQLLPVMAAQVLAVAGLPAIHQDPFDRLLVAQAQSEELLLLSADRLVLQYPGTTDASR